MCYHCLRIQALSARSDRRTSVRGRFEEGVVMNLTLSVVSDQLDAIELEDLARDLCNSINRETSAQARLQEHETDPPVKGPDIGLGTIILTLLEAAEWRYLL